MNGFWQSIEYAKLKDSITNTFINIMIQSVSNNYHDDRIRETTLKRKDFEGYYVELLETEYPDGHIVYHTNRIRAKGGGLFGGTKILCEAERDYCHMADEPIPKEWIAYERKQKYEKCKKFIKEYENSNNNTNNATILF
jgi:hypothetical protein